jgi:hypothetical protein
MKRQPPSPVRKLYIIRLAGRIAVLICTLISYFLKPEWFTVLESGNFFKEFSPLHILWLIWVIDMLCQVIPIKKYIPLGSQKLFGNRFRAANENVSRKSLKEYIISSSVSAYKIFAVWAVLTALIGVLHYFGIFSDTHLFIISVTFYVCDLICVLIWCPFRLFMKNRCCTTCRIFNWDHLMMFTPMLYLKSFYSNTLVISAVTVWLVWEIMFALHPERFWFRTNEALRCSECRDKLCTQRCNKK